MRSTRTCVDCGAELPEAEPCPHCGTTNKSQGFDSVLRQIAKAPNLPVAAPAPLVGRALGETSRFEILSQLGSGGMGVVYQAFDRERQARVALKTLRSFAPDALLRFKNEFRALQGVRHPNLIKLGELIEEDGLWFFTMELVDGTDFKSYVRARGGDLGYDEERLRASLAQLAGGLEALHRAGKVHRDVKPSNIRVRADGRVVLLDFGLVKETIDGDSWTAEVAGTAAYMAPEQALSGSIGAPVDWYACGVLLYECLTGRLPFTETGGRLLVIKERELPPPPRELNRSVASELDALCMRLLEISPERRASGRDVLAIVQPREVSSLKLPTSARAGALFVGRERELAELTAAFDKVSVGSAVAVLIEGESGVGKSALVRRFISSVVEEREAIAFAGRCYEQESVPYKALDGVVDALSRFMRRLAPKDAAELLPQRANLLAQAFPVLGRVEAIAGAPARRGVPPDPQERRMQVFGAMRELFARIAERHRLVIAIDDLQWTDVDSLALLNEIMIPPDAPPLLLLATLRPREDRQPPLDDAAALKGEVRRIQLTNLAEAEALELAGRLLAHRDADAQAIAAEAAGHPLFIAELASYVATHDLVRGQEVRLDDVLAQRILELPLESRRIVELIALAGASVSQEVILRAWAADRIFEFHDHVRQLKIDRLVRTAGAQLSDGVEPYHDRVKAAVLGLIPAETKQKAHGRLALALESSLVPDAELLANHWRDSGDLERAFRWAELAAKRAADSLAFEKAARLYRWAIELGVAPEAAARVLKIRRAEALGNAGLSAEAAQLYLEAAKSANASEALELKRHASDQLLRCGRVDEGTAVVRDVLSHLNLSFPVTPFRAVVGLLLDRLLLRLGRYRFVRRDESELPPSQLAKLDVCWAVGNTYPSIDPIRGAFFQARQLRLALKAGEPFRIARGLALEAVGTAMSGPRGAAAGDRLLARAEELAAPLGRAEAGGLVSMSRGCVALLRAEFREAVEQCDRAVDILSRVGGMPWELDNARFLSILSLTLLGELRELLARLPALIRMAQDRGDRYLAAQLRTGQPIIAWLALDQIDEARWHASESMREWSRSGFHVQHANDIAAHTLIDLYLGDCELAQRRFDQQWSGVERSFMLRIYLIRAIMFDLRGRLAIANAARAPQKSAEQRRLLTVARADARRLEREKTVHARASARQLQAGAMLVEGDSERGVALLEAAALDFDAHGAKLRAAVMRRLIGQLRGGSEGEELIQRADAWMKSEGIARPDRVAGIYTSGFARG